MPWSERVASRRSASRRSGLKGRVCEAIVAAGTPSSSWSVEVELREWAFSISSVREGSFSRSSGRGALVVWSGFGWLMAVAELLECA